MLRPLGCLGVFAIAFYVVKMALTNVSANISLGYAVI